MPSWPLISLGWKSCSKLKLPYLPYQILKLAKQKAVNEKWCHTRFWKLGIKIGNINIESIIFYWLFPTDWKLSNQRGIEQLVKNKQWPRMNLLWKSIWPRMSEGQKLHPVPYQISRSRSAIRYPVVPRSPVNIYRNTGPKYPFFSELSNLLFTIVAHK